MIDQFYEHYFEQLAVKNKLIAHKESEQAFFFIQDPYDLEAFDNAIGATGKTPALLLEDFDNGIYDGNARNYGDKLACRFTIVKSTEVGSRATITAAKRHCALIARQFLKRMLKDLGEGGVITIGQQVSPKLFFKMSSAKISKVGPMAVNHYGVTVGFELTAGFNAQSDANDWAD